MNSRNLFMHEVKKFDVHIKCVHRIAHLFHPIILCLSLLFCHLSVTQSLFYNFNLNMEVVWINTIIVIVVYEPI